METLEKYLPKKHRKGHNTEHIMSIGTTQCSICHRTLSQKKYVTLGVGPICLGKQKKKDEEREREMDEKAQPEIEEARKQLIAKEKILGNEKKNSFLCVCGENLGTAESLDLHANMEKMIYAKCKKCGYEKAVWKILK